MIIPNILLISFNYKRNFMSSDFQRTRLWYAIYSFVGAKFSRWESHTQDFTETTIVRNLSERVSTKHFQTQRFVWPWPCQNKASPRADGVVESLSACLLLQVNGTESPKESGAQYRRPSIRLLASLEEDCSIACVWIEQPYCRSAIIAPILRWKRFYSKRCDQRAFRKPAARLIKRVSALANKNSLTLELTAKFRARTTEQPQQLHSVIA